MEDQRRFIESIYKNGESRKMKYMTMKDVIWTKAGDSIIIHTKDGTILTYLRYSQGKSALGWDTGGHR